MWQRLAMTSLGVIDSAELELGSGFTVITGETGAGKTMVVTALGLLTGRRADAGMVRRGEARAVAEATVVDSPDAAALREAYLAIADRGGADVTAGRILELVNAAEHEDVGSDAERRAICVDLLTRAQRLARGDEIQAVGHEAARQVWALAGATPPMLDAARPLVAILRQAHAGATSEARKEIDAALRELEPPTDAPSARLDAPITTLAGALEYASTLRSTVSKSS